jgi:hypothetical protein
MSDKMAKIQNNINERTNSTNMRNDLELSNNLKSIDKKLDKLSEINDNLSNQVVKVNNQINLPQSKTSRRRANRAYA